ncbi:Glycerophosphodiester phosphodiesterase protein kinase domain-containing GDPDL2 [Spatholobus suberectus]|nr:Glycerophosphodiester phosphodiesterase protein kinase domain-containing GDPDL2 [Spatholobus suberectus]
MINKDAFFGSSFVISIFLVPISSSNPRLLMTIPFSIVHQWKEMNFQYNIPCLSSSTYQVYAIPSRKDIRKLSLALCTKMYYASSLLSRTVGDTYLLLWSEPTCKHCESKGKSCRLKDNGSNNQSLETECFGKGTSSNSKAIVITGATLGPLSFAVLAVAVISVYISYRIRMANQAMMEKFLQEYKAFTSTRYSYNELKKITNHFAERLGEGAYGTVFKGKISEDVTVAVKILKVSGGNGEEFITEVGTLSRIHHVNVVRLVGYCADGLRRALIYEFSPNGSLDRFITSPDNTNHFLGWRKLEAIAMGMAKGIEYLHQGCDQRILHFDLKPQNILLDHNFTPKISDFGLAKLCAKAQSAVSISTVKGTMGYIAPEVFSRCFGSVSCKSDVYSFGMMLLEMIGGRKISEVTEGNRSSDECYPTWIYNLLEERDDIRICIEAEEDAEIAKKLAIVGLWCIQWHPVDRVSMTVAIQMLESEGQGLTVPPNPFTAPVPATEDTNISRRCVTRNLEVIQEEE